MRNSLEVQHAFTPVGKLDPGAQQRLLHMEIGFRELAQQVVEMVPECADRTAALRKLLESKMTCVQAISHYKTEPQSAAKEKENDHQEEKSETKSKQKGKA